MRRIFVLFTALASAGAVPRVLSAQACQSARTALVLSGGGAKGLAHIGVLRVLDSLGIRPDLIVGTSMGAVIGGMYASGYTGRQIDSLARSLPIAGLFRSYEPKAPRSMSPVRPLLVWEGGDRGFTLQRSAVREGEVNALLNAAMLRGNLQARGDFDSLPIPFRAVATDLNDRSRVVLASGDLAEAVRASMAIPLVFEPQVIDGRFLADGGLVDNVPVAVARDLGADRVIVSDATEHLADSVNLYNPLVLADRVLSFLFLQGADSLAPGDVYIRPDVDGFENLNFSTTNTARLIDEGYRASAVAFGAAPCLPPTAASRAAARPPSRLTGATVSGGDPGDQRYVLRKLGLRRGDSLDVRALRGRLTGLSTSETYRSIWVRPSGHGDSVALDLELHKAPARLVALGVAYDNELGGRLWIGGVDRTLLGSGLETSATLLVGGLRDELILGWRKTWLEPARPAPALTVRAARESIRRFDATGDEISDLRVDEVIGFLGLEQTLRQGWSAALGFEGRAWNERLGPSGSTVGGAARFARAGRSGETVLRLEAELYGDYQRFTATAEVRIRLGHVGLRPFARYGWGNRLPLQETFQLGGTEGFPGLHIGEVRGDREVLTGVHVTHPLAGALQMLATVAAGRTAVGGTELPLNAWRLGVALGLGVESPLGPVQLQFGRTAGNRDAVYLRIGRWF